MNTLMFRSFSVLTLLVLLFVLLTGCGGVAKNPAQPGWQDKTQGEKTAGEAAKGEGKEIGAPEIPVGASFEELIQTGKLSLEGGFVRTAAEAFSKAHSDRRDSPDAALAYVIAKLAGSPEELSLIMEPGIHWFYYNTPMVGRWEMFPAPLAETDSYFLRLVSIGAKYGTKNQPKTPAAPATPPAGKTTLKTPKDGETSTTQEGQTILPGLGPDGSGSTGIAPNPDGEKQAQMLNPGRGLAQSGLTGGDLSPNTGGISGGSGKTQYEGASQSKQVEYYNLDKDIFPALITEYQDLARTYSAGLINLSAVKTNVGKLKTLVDDLVKVMDEARAKAEEEDFAIELPVKLDQKPGVYKMYFKNVDFMIVYGYLKIIQAEIEYRSAYNDTASDIIFAPIEDSDGDNILTPLEYYPAEPYGNLIEKGGENLTSSSKLFMDALDILVTNFDTLYNDTNLADFNGNLLIPLNLDHLLLDKISECRDKFSDTQVLFSAGKGDRKFKTMSADVKAEVDITRIFGEKAPASVVTFLPSFDATTFEPALTPESNMFPDPTWGGIFFRGFDDMDVFLQKGDIKGTLTNQGAGIKDVNIATADGKSVKTDEKGNFSLKGIEMNELLGITVTVTAPEIPIPAKAQIHSFWVFVDQQVISGALSSTPPGGPVVETQGGDEGVTSVAPPDGSSESPLGRIKEFREEIEKSKGESGNGEKEGDGSEKSGDG